MRVGIRYSQLYMLIITVLSVIYYLLNIVFPTDFSLDADNSNRIWPQIAGALLAFASFIIILPNIGIIWKNYTMRLFTILLLIAVVYLFYPFKPFANFSFFIRSYMAIIYMLACYVLIVRSKDDLLWVKAIYIIFIVQLVYCLFSLIHDYFATYELAEEGFDSNSGFMLLTCIPLALMFPAKRLRAYLYALLVVACLFSGQRSAALSAIISFPFCLSYFNRSIKTKDVLLLAALTIIIGLPIIAKSIDNINLRNDFDIGRDNLGSGRLVFWGIVIKSFLSGNFFTILFGNGTNSVATLLESYYGIAIGAHNGWLDMLYTFGIPGIIIYSILVFNLLFRSKGMRRISKKFSVIYIVMFVIFLVRCSTSHGYFDISMIPFCTAIAVLEGHVNKHKTISSLNGQ